MFETSCLLLDSLKRHGYYKGQIRSLYNQKLRELLSPTNDYPYLYILYYGGEVIVILKSRMGSWDTPDKIERINFTPEIAREIDISKVKMGPPSWIADYGELSIPLSPTIEAARKTTLCVNCWVPLWDHLTKVVATRMIPYDVYECSSCRWEYSKESIEGMDL